MPLRQERGGVAERIETIAFRPQHKQSHLSQAKLLVMFSKDSSWSARSEWSGSEGRLQKGLKTLTDSEDRFDVSAVVGAELLPKVANMNVQGSPAVLCAVAPNSLQENVAGDGFTRVLD